MTKYIIGVDQHNPAQKAVDTFVNTPPSPLVDGYRCIVGVEPTGEFVGYTNYIAWVYSGAWQFYQPSEGWTAYVEALGQSYIYFESEWKPDIAIHEVEEMATEELDTQEFDYSYEYPPKIIADAAYSLIDDDNSRLLSFTSTSNVTVTIPANHRHNLGSLITIMQQGIGYVNIVAASGVTLFSANGETETRNRYSVINLIKIANNIYVLGGDLA